MAHHQKFPPGARPLGLSAVNSISIEPTRTEKAMKHTLLNAFVERIPGLSQDKLTPERDNALVPTGPGDRPKADTYSYHPFGPQITDRGYPAKPKRKLHDDAEMSTSKRVKIEREAPCALSLNKLKKASKKNAADENVFRPTQGKNGARVRKEQADDKNVFRLTQGSSGRNDIWVKQENIKPSSYRNIDQKHLQARRR